MRYEFFETKEKLLIKALTRYLKKNNIYYELSGIGFDGWRHFSIKVDDSTSNKINNFLDKYYDFMNKKDN